MHKEGLQFNDLPERRTRDVFEFVNSADLQKVTTERFGLTLQDLSDLAAGDALVEYKGDAKLTRGIFMHSAEAYLQAQTKGEQADAWDYFCKDIETTIFEEVIRSGHFEEFRFTTDPTTHDAYLYNKESLGQIYLRDLMLPTYKWRAQLSFVEFMNNNMIGELSRRGVLNDYVFIEPSLYAFDATTEQASDVGYRHQNEKAYLRAYTDQADERVLQTLSYSHLYPHEVDILRAQNGLPKVGLTNTQDTLQAGFLISKSEFAKMGGLVGVAAQLDTIKMSESNMPMVFGEAAAAPQSLQDYLATPDLSVERKERAKQVSADYAYNVMSTFIAMKNGLIPLNTVTDLMGQHLLFARQEVLKGDRELVVEQYSNTVVQQIDWIAFLRQHGQEDQAIKEEKKLQQQLGDAVVCGLQVKVDQNGSIVNPDGSEADCKEIKNGDVGKCPGCKHVVFIKVDLEKKLFCPRKVCSLSKSGGRTIKTKQLQESPQQQTSDHVPHEVGNVAIKNADLVAAA
jgi:hypothetical protein